MTTSFWILWGFSAIVAIVVLFFFFTGLADGSITGFNMNLWLLLLIITVGIPVSSLWLKAHDHLVLAKTLLWLIAAPGLIYLGFVLIMIFGNQKWN